MKLNPHPPDNGKPSSWISWHWYFPMVNTGNSVANCVLNFVAYVALLVIPIAVIGCMKAGAEHIITLLVSCVLLSAELIFLNMPSLIIGFVNFMNILPV
ncbi:MAG: hypothetical protein LE169_01605 [Endomicrobium sp.]|nr:hypothetical protein [Endomicrobium sp.]